MPVSSLGVSRRAAPLSDRYGKLYKREVQRNCHRYRRRQHMVFRDSWNSGQRYNPSRARVIRSGDRELRFRFCRLRQHLLFGINCPASFSVVSTGGINWVPASREVLGNKLENPGSDREIFDRFHRQQVSCPLPLTTRLCPAYFTWAAPYQPE